MLHLNIPQPCHEKWEDMSPTEKGAYCQSCCKEVTDFSGMEDEEIAKYFLERNNQPVCGRFLNTQLNRPLLYISPDVLQMNIPYWKKFLAALFICFSSLLVSCNNKTDESDIDNIIEWEPAATTKQSLIANNNQSSGKLSIVACKFEKEKYVTRIGDQYFRSFSAGMVEIETDLKPPAPIWDVWAEYPGKYPHRFNNK